MLFFMVLVEIFQGLLGFKFNRYFIYMISHCQKKPCMFWLTADALAFCILIIMMGLCKEDVTPLLTYWSYVFLAITCRLYIYHQTLYLLHDAGRLLLQIWGDDPLVLGEGSPTGGPHHILDKQRVLMHGHQGWNVRHGLCHIYMRYVYIYMSCL